MAQRVYSRILSRLSSLQAHVDFCRGQLHIAAAQVQKAADELGSTQFSGDASSPPGQGCLWDSEPGRRSLQSVLQRIGGANSSPKRGRDGSHPPETRGWGEAVQKTLQARSASERGGKKQHQAAERQRGRFPTRTRGPDFGEPEARPPGLSADHGSEAWTLQRILEVHRANAANHGRGRPLPTAELATPTPGADSAEAHEQAATTGQPQLGASKQPPARRQVTTQRLRSIADGERGTSFLETSQSSDHRWAAPAKGLTLEDAIQQLQDFELEADSAESSPSDVSAPEEASGRGKQSVGRQKPIGSRKQPKPVSYSKDLLLRLEKQPSPLLMLRLFEDEMAKGTKPHNNYIIMMAKRLAREKRVQDIWSLIRRARELGLPPATGPYRHLIEACGKQPNFYALREVIPAYLEAGLPLTKHFLETAISSCGRSRKFQYGWDLVHLMEAAGMQPAINTVNALLNMYAEGLQPDMAQEVFDKLQDTGMKATFVTWCILGKAWSKVGNVAKTRAVFNVLCQDGGEPPLAAWDALLCAHTTSGDLVGAQQVIDDLRSRCGLEKLRNKFTVGMYTVLINAYSRRGDMASAEVALREAETLGRPTKQMYCAVISGYENQGDYESCLRMAHESEANNVNLGRVGLTLLIEAAMQAWHQQGRPPHLLDAAVNHFQAARHYWSTAGFAPRAPEGSQLDLHTLSPWSAQLLLLDFLRTISARIDAGWQFPRCDLTIVTGKGSHTRAESAREGCSVRDVTLRFLQSMFSPRLAAKNDGIVTVRRWEVLQFLQAAKKTGQLLEPKAFASFLMPYK